MEIINIAKLESALGGVLQNFVQNLNITTIPSLKSEIKDVLDGLTIDIKITVKAKE